MHVNVLFDDCLLTIVPAPLGLEKILTYTEKKMVEINDPKRPWVRRDTQHFQVPLYTLIGTDPRIIQTYAGLMDRVLAFCVEHGYDITRLFDGRQDFMAPRLDLMTGFRFKQKQLVTDLLLKKRSGMLRAPTRYGKSTCIKNVLRACPGVTTVVTAPGRDLVKQLYADIKESLPHREVQLIGAGSTVKYPSEDITVASMDSLHKCDPGRTRLLLIDEPHAAVTDSRAQEVVKFNMARKYGFGATLDGRFDGRDMLIEGLIGPVLVERTYTEAVEEGAICPIVVYMLRVKFADYATSSRDAAYNNLMFRSPRMADLTAKICRELVPEAWQTIVFIKDENQADLFLKHIGEEGVIAMAKKMNTKERNTKLKLMEDNVIKRCLATKIYSTGVTFHDVRVLVNAEAGGGNISAIQKPGRLAEIRPDKKCGVVFDFLFECECDDLEGRRKSSNSAWWNVVRDSQSRLKVYRDKGYEINIVEGWGELERKFNERAL
jgi:superfamily II DNA or RNA helicase